MRKLTSPEVIISLHEVHARALIQGAKCVELRRRAPNLTKGTRVWLYAKVPVGQVLGYGVLESITVASPDDIWAKFERCSGLSHHSFLEYFTGTERGAALKFASITVLEQPVGLAELRRVDPGFHPPQFFARVRDALRERLSLSIPAAKFQPCDHHPD